MATVNCNCCSSQIQIQKYGSPFPKYPNRELFKCKRSSSVSVPLPLKRAAAVERRRMITVASIRNNKVYEDKSQGIVCYEDERGEIICEGYDEGPCFQRLPNPTSYYHHPRDAEMTNVVIRQGWLKIESHEEAVLKEDLNSCNGFNSFR